MEARLEEFLISFVEKMSALTKKEALAYFEATTTGNSEKYKEVSEVQLEISRFLSDRKAFSELKEFKQSGKIEDDFLKRQLELVYNNYAAHQFNENLQEEIIALSVKIEEQFSKFRAKLDGETVTDNKIDEILKTSSDAVSLRRAWEASKEIGVLVESDVRRLAELRNKAAEEMGYKNYHSMSLALNEQDPFEIERLFDELDNLTAKAFVKLKEEIDTFLSEKNGISRDELMPWHYQDRFFQEGPAIYKFTPDKYFEGKNVVELSQEYYYGLGLPVEDILEKSDLYEKDGKYQHAYCINIDRMGDVRIVCNVKHNYRWMGTMLHELGHAVYDKEIAPNIPWILSEPAHIFTTEAIAMLFGRMASNAEWLYDMKLISSEEKPEIESAGRNLLRLEQLVFSRWVQVMYRFEKAMYENPLQDLNSLWWSLAEKYQMIKKPEGRNSPDWAAKIHVALYPAYYHNYMLGELLASQLNSYICRKVIGTEKLTHSFCGIKNVGSYLKHLVFSPGSVYKWDEMIFKATGEKLTPAYYAEQFISGE